MAELMEGSWRISGGTWFKARAVFLGCATGSAVSDCHIGHELADLVLPRCLQ